MPDLQDIDVLVIEAHPAMRAQLRSMLNGIRVTRVTFVASALSAVEKLQTRQFDLILCEYALGPGQDGQHLLEDLRTRRIIPLDTVFIMISGERNYERVIGAAELAPNDYILKPLTPGTLHERIERAMHKRDTLQPVYRLIESGAYREAIEYCERGQDELPRYRTDFMRLRAELLGERGLHAKAEDAYREILRTRHAPWARLGLAKMLFARKQYEDAEMILESLVAESRDYLDAYDWLAKTREAAGRLREAQDILLTAVERSPHRLGRLRHLGEVAQASGDHATAERAFSEVVRKGKQSAFRDPEDHVRLIKAQLEQGHTADAAESLRDLEQSMSDQPAGAVCSAYAHALLCAASGDRKGAREAMLLAARRRSLEADLSLPLQREMAETCLDNLLEDEGSELITDLLRRATDATMVDSVRESLRARGREDLSIRIEERLHNEVKAYIASGAAKAHAGDYDGAVREMMQAVRKMPGNPHVTFNAALALLRHIEENGWNERFATRARMLIERYRMLDPLNSRLDAINGLLQSLMQRYGIDPTAIAATAASRPASRQILDGLPE
ncbi:MAG: response regulator [Rhodocyclaceae bacterium]|nr:response regulator [Rhodocyclaceae bacterium]